MIRLFADAAGRVRLAVLNGAFALIIAGLVAPTLIATAAPECRWKTATTTPSALHEIALTVVTPGDIWEFGDNGSSAFGNTRHWDGTSWHDVPLPGPGFLAGGSALSPTDIWAVGGTGDTATANPLFAHWNGVAWTLHQLASGAFPSKVAMTSSTDGWAVGQLNGPPAGIYHFDGTNWAPVSFPLPAGAGGAFLPAVRALSVNDVWAVGRWWTNGDQGYFLPLVEHWNGAAWSVVPFPTPAGRSIVLDAIDGVAGDLWVAGMWRASGAAGALVAHGDGTNWDTSPDSLRGGELDSVSRVASGNVWVSGIDSQGASSNGTFPLLTMHWDGVTWTRTPNANAIGGPTGMFTGIAGLSDGTAWLAVGDFQNGHTERWSCSSAPAASQPPAAASAAVPSLPRAGAEGFEPGGRPWRWPAPVFAVFAVVMVGLYAIRVARRVPRR